MESRKNILTEKGKLNCSGVFFDENLIYNKNKIPFYLRSRIKERDYYSFSNEKISFLITIANNSYMSYVSFSLIDLIKKDYITKTYLSLLSPKKITLSKTPLNRNIEIKDSRFYISIKKVDNLIKIAAKFTHFTNKLDLSLKLDVKRNSANSSIYILHPFKNKHQFYYNFKENLLLGNGYLKLGNNEKLDFIGDGVYDFGRGIWPYKTEWFWISTSSIKDNIGFNLGFGFGNSEETENMVYYDNQNFKLDDLTLDIPKIKNKIDYLSERKLSSKNNDINLTFTPIINRKDSLDFLILSTRQNQVFGRFNGTIKTKEKIIEFNDSLGFIEHFKNRW